jgi:hypothetical protein
MEGVSLFLRHPFPALKHWRFDVYLFVSSDWLNLALAHFVDEIFQISEGLSHGILFQPVEIILLQSEPRFLGDHLFGLSSSWALFYVRFHDVMQKYFVSLLIHLGSTFFEDHL